MWTSIKSFAEIKEKYILLLLFSIIKKQYWPVELIWLTVFLGNFKGLVEKFFLSFFYCFCRGQRSKQYHWWYWKFDWWGMMKTNCGKVMVLFNSNSYSLLIPACQKLYVNPPTKLIVDIGLRNTCIKRRQRKSF